MAMIAKSLLGFLIFIFGIQLIPGAENFTPGSLEFFEKKIRPVLAEHCFECHSSDSKKLKASLYLDTRAGFLKGGDTGPAIVPATPKNRFSSK